MVSVVTISLVLVWFRFVIFLKMVSLLRQLRVTRQLCHSHTGQLYVSYELSTGNALHLLCIRAGDRADITEGSLMHKC